MSLSHKFTNWAHVEMTMLLCSLLKIFWQQQMQTDFNNWEAEQTYSTMNLQIQQFHGQFNSSDNKTTLQYSKSDIKVDSIQGEMSPRLAADST